MAIANWQEALPPSQFSQFMKIQIGSMVRFIKSNAFFTGEVTDIAGGMILSVAVLGHAETFKVERDAAMLVPPVEEIGQNGSELRADADLTRAGRLAKKHGITIQEALRLLTGSIE